MEHFDVGTQRLLSTRSHNTDCLLVHADKDAYQSTLYDSAFRSVTFQCANTRTLFGAIRYILHGSESLTRSCHSTPCLEIKRNNFTTQPSPERYAINLHPGAVTRQCMGSRAVIDDIRRRLFNLRRELHHC